MKLTLFEQFIQEFTYVDEELNPEERQQILQARLTNGKFPRDCALKFCRGFPRDSIFSTEISRNKSKESNLFTKHPTLHLRWIYNYLICRCALWSCRLRAFLRCHSQIIW